MRSDQQSMPSDREGYKGYILFEVILAVTVFSLAFVGFINVMNQTSRAANEFAFERIVNDGLDAALTEAKQREIGEMALRFQDEVTGISYHTEVEPLALAAASGKSLRNLYLLRATATFSRAGREETRVAEVWIHREKT